MAIFGLFSSLIKKYILAGLGTGFCYMKNKKTTDILQNISKFRVNSMEY
jgi:hypothetical protein